MRWLDRNFWLVIYGVFVAEACVAVVSLWR